MHCFAVVAQPFGRTVMKLVVVILLVAFAQICVGSKQQCAEKGEYVSGLGLVVYCNSLISNLFSV